MKIPKQNKRGQHVPELNSFFDSEWALTQFDVLWEAPDLVFGDISHVKLRLISKKM